jgi:hypothetical protein
MNYKEIANHYQLPVKSIVEMHNRCIINDPISESEHKGLLMIQSIWGKDTFLKMQLSRKTKKERLTLALTCELSKIESYILMRYIGNLRDHQKIYIKQIADELNFYYGVPIDRLLYSTIKKFRGRAYKLYSHDEKINQLFSKAKKPKHDSDKLTKDDNINRKAFGKIFGY